MTPRYMPGAEIMANAAAEREKRRTAEKWMIPALEVLTTASNTARRQNANRITAVTSNMTDAQRAALPEYVDPDLAVVQALRAHFRAELQSEVLATVEEWDAKISNSQQDDMPGFVRNFTPGLIEKIQEL